MQKSIVFCVAFFLMSGNDQYGRRVLLWGGGGMRFLASLFDIQMLYLVYVRISMVETLYTINITSSANKM